MHKKIVVIAFTLMIALSSLSTFASEGSSEKIPGGDINSQIINDPVGRQTTPLTASNTPFGQVQLSWPKSPSGTGYIIYRYDTLLQRYEPIKTITDTHITTYVDKNVEENLEYRYQVTPVLAKAEHSNSVIASIRTKSVSPAAEISVESTAATITWSTVSGASGYEIYRAASADGKYEKAATVATCTFSDKNLKKGTAYFYKVRAFQGEDFTAFSSVIQTDVIGKDDLVWPIPASTSPSCGFGPRVSPTGGASSDHKGIDIPAPSGSQVVAAQSGTVIESSYNGLSGNYIVIQHDNGIATKYQHLSSSKVSTGDYVKVGETIALSGNTGVSTGAHLHFEVHVNGVPVDPMKYL